MFESIKNWHSIRTAAQLKTVILRTAADLDTIGQSAIATDWRKRVNGGMPSKMGKESINYVLFLCCAELENVEGIGVQRDVQIGPVYNG